ncbi:hypothetical protein FQ087_20705 [Sporosarcina sp. ANT_H38]|uniref:hypothetical protein n=1 Tax=Sporosarcina sp. ANT_H38 TaxID=2597358 RepID=UPI0011F1DDA4|nr:hypothetical protein [Sporosarcina sp. ANT_H38]KAA0941580.1 hypothetical protein FQ087_20705 [Sporosarcina sp. ANT_H38]
MLKGFFILLLASILLVGCSESKKEPEVNKADQVEETKTLKEITPNLIISYMEMLTGDYLMTDHYQTGGKEQLQKLGKAAVDIDAISMELKEEYEQDIPAVIDLLKLAETVDEAIDQMINGEFSTKYDNSVKVGQVVGDISREYLDGKLPPTIKVITGKENADD